MEFDTSLHDDFDTTSVPRQDLCGTPKTNDNIAKAGVPVMAAARSPAMSAAEDMRMHAGEAGFQRMDVQNRK